MVCKESQELTPFELILFHAKVWHAILNDSNSWLVAEAMLNSAEKRGLFENVEMFPERPKSELLQTLGGALQPEISTNLLNPDLYEMDC